MNLYAIIDRPDRLARSVRACTSGSGADHRGVCYTFGDSTDGNPCFKLDGTGAEDSDWPRGRRHGFELALMRAGLYWGGPLFNNCRNTELAYSDDTSQCNGFRHGAADGVATDPYADATAIALVAGSSMPFAGNDYFFGCTPYINAVAKPASPAFVVVGRYERANPISKSFTNPFPLGNQTTEQVRLHYRYKTNSDTTDFYVQVENFSTNRGTNHHSGPSANTGGEFVHDSILCDVNNTGSFSLYVSLHDHVGGNQSVGPVQFSGIRFTHKDVEHDSPTTGPCGFAVAPLFTRVGNTLTQLASDLKYLQLNHPMAIPEWFRAGQGTAQCIAKHGFVLLHYLGNDVLGSADSFAYADTPAGVSARDTPPNGSGPTESDPAGVVQNLSTISQILEEAWVTAGFSLSDFRIIFKGAHPQPAGTTAATAYPTIMDGVCDWNAGSATYAAYQRSGCLVVQRTERQVSAQHIMDVQGYGQAAVLAITGISAANPPVITCASHGIVTSDIVWFTATNEKMDSPGIKLSASSDPTGTGARPARQFVATRINANTISVPTGAAPAVAGTTGFICCRKDYSHIGTEMQEEIGQQDLDLLLETASVGGGGGGSRGRGRLAFERARRR